MNNTIDDIKAALAFIGDAYPQCRFHEGTAASWHALLSDIQRDKLMAATIECCKDGIPQPAMIRAAVFRRPRSPEFQSAELERVEAPLPGNLVPNRFKVTTGKATADTMRSFTEWLSKT